jgi:serine/threonine protein kinase
MFSGGKWKLGDLGLVEHREKSFLVDEPGEWIGPRGWQSPESLNKFVTERTPWGHKFDCKIDHQSDLYQLGKLLWYVVQGNCPEGGIDRANFLAKDDRLYQIAKTLLNNSKKRRLPNIDELIKEIKTVYNIYYKTNPSFTLHD